MQTTCKTETVRHAYTQLIGQWNRPERPPPVVQSSHGGGGSLTSQKCVSHQHRASSRQQNWKKLVTLPLRGVRFLVLWSIRRIDFCSLFTLMRLSGRQSAPRFRVCTIPIQKTELLCQEPVFTPKPSDVPSPYFFCAFWKRNTKWEHNTFQASATWQREAGQRKPVINITVSTTSSWSSR